METGIHAFSNVNTILQGLIWFWSDGSKFDYSDWHTGEPNNGGNNERCVEMGYGGNIQPTHVVYVLNLFYHHFFIWYETRTVPNVISNLARFITHLCLQIPDCTNAYFAMSFSEYRDFQFPQMRIAGMMQAVTRISLSSVTKWLGLTQIDKLKSHVCP